jgi:hypothetical protein
MSPQHWLHWGLIDPQMTQISQMKNEWKALQRASSSPSASSSVPIGPGDLDHG